MKEKTTMRGEYRVEARDAATGALLWVQRFKNQLTAINRTIRSEMLRGTYTGALDALQIKYFAFGTGSTPATVNDTALETETLRKQVTQMTAPAPGTVQTICSLGAEEANFLIREIGIFGGPDATTAAGSGTLISRAVVNIEKNSNIVLNIVRQDICTI